MLSLVAHQVRLPVLTSSHPTSPSLCCYPHTVDQPDLSTAVVSDIATFSQEASCGSTPESSCVAAYASDVSGPPPKRNGYASAPLFASYSGEVYGGTGPYTARAPLVLLYGGVATVGGPPPTRVFGECGWPGCTPAPLCAQNMRAPALVRVPPYLRL